jgi:hypothetical protein
MKGCAYVRPITGRKHGSSGLTANSHWRAIAVAAAVLLLSGCSGTMFTSYPGKINPIIAGLNAGAALDTGKLLAAECRGSDRILYSMERGRIAHILGNVDGSLRDFNVSMEAIRFNETKALITAVSAAENVGALLFNDNAISYEGEGYERVMLHHYQALNFLTKRDLEGAAVEVRRANNEQVEALRRFEREVDAVEKEADEKRISSKSQSIVSNRYAQMNEIAGKVKNSFQNAYTFYVSGFIYELLDQANDAYIDYKKALEIYPENHFIQQDVIRLAASLNMEEDLNDLQARFGSHRRRPPTETDNAGELLVLFEDGLAPQKQEVRIALPFREAGLVTLAFPIYAERYTPQIPLSISSDTKFLGSTETICDIRALAVKALKEKAPIIATRQLIRALAKGASNHAAKKQFGDLGILGMNVINYATEQADLRSWLTLPANAQVLRVSLPPGRHRIVARHARGGTTADVEILPNGKTLLRVVRVGRHFYTASTSFQEQFMPSRRREI